MDPAGYSPVSSEKGLWNENTLILFVDENTLENAQQGYVTGSVSQTDMMLHVNMSGFVPVMAVWRMKTSANNALDLLLQLSIFHNNLFVAEGKESG